MAVEIMSLSISTKVWDRTGIKLATPGSAVRLASVARHVTDCATRHSGFANYDGCAEIAISKTSADSRQKFCADSSVSADGRNCAESSDQDDSSRCADGNG